MKQTKQYLICSLMIALLFSTLTPVLAQQPQQQRQLLCVVEKGDTLWKISRRHQMKLDNIVQANPHLENPDLIYPGNKIYSPNHRQQPQQQRTPQQDRSQQKQPEPEQPEQKPTDNIQAIKAKVIDLVNQERQKRGLQPYQHSQQLSDVAQTKAQDMVDNNYFSHTSPTYGSPFEMLKQFNIQYTAAGENIAQGQRTAEQVVNSWMDSPGHRRNILSQKFTQIGIGLARDENETPSWVQMFVRP